MICLRVVVVAGVVALGALLTTSATPIYANGVPTMVSLSYLDGLSNWGPREASGTLELAFGEGYAKVTAAGMQRLERQRYQGWLVNSQSNDAISIGTFNATVAGAVNHRSTLPPIANFGFDLFIITVEPDPDDAPQPTADRSIGGRFSLVGPRTADGLLLGEPISGPRQLPNTGDGSLRSDIVRIAVLLSAVAAALLAGMRLGRRHA